MIGNCQGHKGNTVLLTIGISIVLCMGNPRMSIDAVRRETHFCIDVKVCSSKFQCCEVSDFSSQATSM